MGQKGPLKPSTKARSWISSTKMRKHDLMLTYAGFTEEISFDSEAIIEVIDSLVLILASLRASMHLIPKSR